MTEQEGPQVVSDIPFSEEQIREIEKQTQALIKDEVLANAWQTMLQGRQLYYAGLQTFNGRLAELGEPVDSPAAKALVHSVAHVAHQGFDLPTLVEGLQQHALIWLQSVIAADIHKVQVEDAKAMEAYHEARLKKTVPIGFRWSRDQLEPPYKMPRGRPLVVAGNTNAVRFLLDKACEAVQKEPVEGQYRPTCLRLSAKSFNKPKSKRETFQVRELPSHSWFGKMTSLKKITEALAGAMKQMENQQLDLLIIDDARHMGGPGISGSSPLRGASKLMKTLTKWAEARGCAVVAGVPLRGELSDAKVLAPVDTAENTFEWQGFYDWTELRHIAITEGPYDEDYECDTYHILLDGLAAIEQVDRKIIDGV